MTLAEFALGMLGGIVILLYAWIESDFWPLRAHRRSTVYDLPRMKQTIETSDR